MYVKSHVDVPSLFRLLGCMKADNGGGMVSVDLKDRAPEHGLDLPVGSKWRPLAALAKADNTEQVFAGL